MTTNRRSFLGLLAAAPAAIPVIAKDAAAKMRLTSITGPGENHYMGEAPSEAYGWGSDASWIKDAIKKMFSEDAIQERMDHARHNARILDGDIASMRSLSPSAAYEIQVKRCYDRLTKKEKGNLEQMLRGETKRLGLMG